jgi:hypothetical protein
MGQSSELAVSLLRLSIVQLEVAHNVVRDKGLMEAACGKRREAEKEESETGHTDPRLKVRFLNPVPNSSSVYEHRLSVRSPCWVCSQKRWRRQIGRSFFFSYMTNFYKPDACCSRYHVTTTLLIVYITSARLWLEMIVGKVAHPVLYMLAVDTGVPGRFGITCRRQAFDRELIPVSVRSFRIENARPFQVPTPSRKLFNLSRFFFFGVRCTAA